MYMLCICACTSKVYTYVTVRIYEFHFQVFISAVVKLVSVQMAALGDQCTLESVCGGLSAFGGSERTIGLLMNLVLPLCVRMGCGRQGKYMYNLWL